jgi:hypothetical protein
MARTPDKPAAVRLARSVDEFSAVTGARTLILNEDGREFLASLPEAGKTA